MKKFILVLLCFGLLLGCFSGCRTSEKMKFLKGGASEIVKEKLDIVLEAIEKKDKEAIKAIMAPNAIDDVVYNSDFTETIDSQIDRLFSAFKGKVQSVEYSSSGSGTSKGGKTSQYGNSSHRYASGGYKVITDQDEYYLWLYDSVKGTDENYTGVYCITLSRVFDKDILNLHSFCGNVNRAGINVADIEAFKKVEKEVQEQGKEEFESVLDSSQSDLNIYILHYLENEKGSQDDIRKLFTFEMSDEMIKQLAEFPSEGKFESEEVTDCGFEKDGKLMYCQGYLDLVKHKETKVLYKVKMKWQKCEQDEKSGITYYAIMPIEDFEKGVEFPEEDGFHIVTGKK